MKQKLALNKWTTIANKWGTIENAPVTLSTDGACTQNETNESVLRIVTGPRLNQ